MNQNEKRQFLIRALLEERPEHQTIAIPHNVEDQKRLLRSLMNVRMPGRISEEFLNVQDAYLQEAVKEKVMKRMFRSARPILMVPASFLGGGIFCLFSDLLARTLFAPTELSVSTVTAAFGAPIVVWVMLKRRSGENG